MKTLELIYLMIQFLIMSAKHKCHLERKFMVNIFNEKRTTFAKCFLKLRGFKNVREKTFQLMEFFNFYCNQIMIYLCKNWKNICGSPTLFQRKSVWKIS